MGIIGCGQVDLRDVPEDEKIVTDQVAWVAGDVSEKIYFYNNRPYCVVTLPQAAYATICDEFNNIPSTISMAAAGANVFGTSSGSDSGGAQTPENSTDNVANTTQPGMDKAKLDIMSSSVDWTSLNKYGFMPAALLPSVCAIPMKSSIRTYGPYVSSNFGDPGGTEVERNTDLAPWVYGGISGMNGAGVSIANAFVAALSRTETGKLTIPGFPVPAITNLGSALAAGGASLSDLNFSYGSTGVTTTYNFKTFTPKYGNLQSSALDRIKEAAKYRTEQLTYLRSQQININKIGRKMARFSGAVSRGIAGRTQTDKGTRAKNSLQRLLIGSKVAWENLPSGGKVPRFIVGASELSKASAEMTRDYSLKAYMSLDAFFLPISKYGDAGLSRFAGYSKPFRANKANPLPIQPAVGRSKNYASSMDEYNLDIDRKYLDPLLGPGDDAHHKGDSTDTGHTIELLGKGSSVDDKSSIASIKSVSDDDRYANDYRFFAMRGPLVLQSWGYDTNGKPIPNASDSDGGAAGGRFVKYNLKDEFLQDWISKPDTWPVAPIDLRFDRERGVWTCPPQYNIIVVELEEKLNANGCAEAKVIQDKIPEMYDKFGSVIQDAYITVCDRIGQSLEARTRVYVYYDAHNNEYIVLNAEKSQSSTTVRFRLVCPSAIAGVDFGDAWTKQTAYGDKALNRHHAAVRIDCDGNPVDAAGTPLNHAYMSAAINDPTLYSGVFITVRDNPGMWGPSYSYWSPNKASSYPKWKSEGATGFGALIGSGYLQAGCAMGVADPCTDVSLPAYDIIFLESYARFIECELTQDLYWDKSASPGLYTDDEWKQANPDGNAAIILYDNHFWGGPGNGKRPMFHDSDLNELPLRVFDPYLSVPRSENKNKRLKSGDRVLAVFDETKKKYFIYDSPKEQDGTVVKFGLAQSWKSVTDINFTAVRLDCGGYPTTTDGDRRLTENDVLTEHLLYVRDSTSVNNEGFGPAAGSSDFNEFITGVPNAYTTPQYYPFRGFAVKESGCYECIYMQQFADKVRGTVVSLSNNVGVNGNCYAGTLDGWTDGVYPAGSVLNGGSPIAAINYKDITAGGDYIAGSFGSGNQPNGCQFLALLDRGISKNGYLQYTMTNAQHLAKRLYITIKNPDKISELNSNGFVRINPNPNDFYVIPEEGFFWDPNTQQTLFSRVSVYNKNWWTGKALILPIDLDAVAISCDLTGYSADSLGIIEYLVNDAATIAQAGHGRIGINSVFTGGIPNPDVVQQNGLAITNNDYRINTNNWQSQFYHGVDPLLNSVNFGNQTPYFYTNRVWLTHSGSTYSFLWDENGRGTNQNIISDIPRYELIRADEAPVIITGRATSTFYPESPVASIALTNVKLDDETVGVQGYASCPYPFYDPIPRLLGTAFNPQRHGAAAGDLVTVQRVSMDDKRPSRTGGDVHYAYIIIGTGDTQDRYPQQ